VTEPVPDGAPLSDGAPETDEAPESMGTVIVAGLVNLAIAGAKAVAGVLSGSAAMLSEAAHSLADTLTEVLLFVALRRGSRPADDDHPFGHGKSAYLWALLAAAGTLVLGAGYAVYQGMRTIHNGEESGHFLVAYAVLVVSFGLEATSLSRAIRQLRTGATRYRVTILRFLRRTPDTTVKAVTLEDSAALVGLVLAGLGLGLTQLTGSSMWDGVASILIGVLLAVVAIALVRTNVSLILGESPPAGLRDQIRDEIQNLSDVTQVIEVLTMYLGPTSLLVAAKVDFAETSVAGLAEASDEAERRLRQRFPLVTHVFLDPTPRPPDVGPGIGTRPGAGQTDTLDG
jgi:cation diffusion facilitator family transporter